MHLVFPDASAVVVLLLLQLFDGGVFGPYFILQDLVFILVLQWIKELLPFL